MGPDNLNVEQLLAALQRKGIPLPFEIGTFLVLQAAEQALVLEATEEGMAAPPRVGVTDIWLTSDGEVSVVPSRSAESEQEACRALVVVLGDLLVRSAPGVTPMLLEIVESGPSDGEWSLMRLRDDLESALVPLNRGALRRVLARLLREVRRDAERAPGTHSPDVRTVDRDLDALFGIESAEVPESVPPSQPPARPRRPLHDSQSGSPAPFEEELSDEEALAPREPSRPRTQTRPERPLAKQQRRPLPEPEADAAESEPKPPPRERAGRAEPEAAAKAEPVSGPAPRLSSRDDSLEAFDTESAGGSGSGARIGLVLALLAAALVVAFLIIGRDRARSLFGIGGGPADRAAGATTPAPSAAEPVAPKRRYGELRITSSPARAQVLLFVGAGPAIAKDLPIGVAHEFVAMADGKSPSRAVVPAGAAWQADGARQRFELALQLEDESAKRGGEDLGPTRLPDDVGRPGDALGDVRVITSPSGAKVYQLIGFTPDVRIENVELGEPLELLVYLSDHALSRVVVRDTDFKDQGGKLVAEVDAQLTRKK